MLDEHIPDEFADFLSNVEQAEAASPTTDEQDVRPSGLTNFVDIHVDDLRPEEQVPPPDIEGNPAEASPDLQYQPEAESEPEDTVPLSPVAPRRSMHLHPLALTSISICGLLALSIGLWYGILPLLTPKAIVTIVPVSKAITATGTITVVTGPASATEQQIPGRLLSAITMSQEALVPTTGTGHLDAHAAHGTITFYNALPASQVIPTGTLLTGADGVEVVTDQEAVIPAAVPPTEGQATVPAHVLTAGRAGNIPDGDISGKCCRDDIFVTSSAFSGGQDARSYSLVTAHDISAAATSLEKSLTATMRAAFMPQVRSDETLIMPLPCTPTVTPDHQAGQEASMIQVTVSLTCTGEAYLASAYEAAVTQMVAHAAAQQLGPGYAESGAVQASITATTYRSHGTVTLAIKAAGTWTYQIDSAERATIIERIAGKSRLEATALLLAMPGVQNAAIEEEHGDRLPDDSSRIQMIIVAYMN